MIAKMLPFICLSLIGTRVAFTMDSNEIIRHFAKEDFQAVIELLDQLPVGDQSKVSNLTIRGRANLALGHPRRAAVDFSRALKANAKYQYQLVGLSGRPLDRRRYGLPIKLLAMEAQVAAGEAELTFPNVSDKRQLSFIRMLEGQASVALGKHQEAVGYFESSLAADCWNSESWSNLALVLASTTNHRLRNLDSANECAIIATLLAHTRTESAAARVSLAAVHGARGKFKNAVDTQREAIRLSPHVNKSLLESTLNDYQLERQVSLVDRSDTAPYIASEILESMVRFKVPDSADNRHRQLRPFWISKTEVTRRQWAAVHRQRQKPNGEVPMDRVNWNDCREFIRLLNRRIGAKQDVFRLPHEYEWQQASNGGDSGRFYFGKNASDLEQHAWYKSNSKQRLHRVGLQKPNPLGLFDVYGNVAEWCHNDEESGLVSVGIIRGGSFANSERWTNSQQRGYCGLRDRKQGVGLRLVANDLPNIRQLILNSDPMQKHGTGRVATLATGPRELLRIRFVVGYAHFARGNPEKALEAFGNAALQDVRDDPIHKLAASNYCCVAAILNKQVAPRFLEESPAWVRHLVSALATKQFRQTNQLTLSIQRKLDAWEKAAKTRDWAKAPLPFSPGDAELIDLETRY